MLKNLIFAHAFLFLLFSCSDKTDTKRNIHIQVQGKALLHEDVKLKISHLGDFDSIHVMMWDKQLDFEMKDTASILIKGLPDRLIDCKIQLHVFHDESVFRSNRLTLKLFPAQESQELNYEVVDERPHARDAYTQGLKLVDGVFFESAGLYGESDIRKVNPLTGEVLTKIEVDPNVFAEGLTVFGDSVFQLTWREHKGYIYNKDDYSFIGEFTYPHEGWGIDADEQFLYVSDGSSTIRLWNPKTCSAVTSYKVRDHNKEYDQLNELEVVGDFIWANVYTTNTILKIEKSTGAVVGRLDLTGLLKDEDRHHDTDVLNGIAYDSEKEVFYVTGKKWSKLFTIRLLQKVI